MIKKQFKKRAISAAFILGVSSLMSRILGVVRDRLIASEFGASGVLDAYFAAFRIPDFIFNLLILGALSSAFIPVFTSYLSKKKEKEAHETANTVMFLTLSALVVISIIVAATMPYLMNVIAPGFEPEKKELATNLSRLLLFSPIFFGLSNIFSGILNSYKKFAAYAAAPIMYNLGIIFGALFLTEKWGVYGLVIGVLIGAFLHFFVQAPSVFKLGFRIKPALKLDAGVKKIGTLMVPRTIGIGMSQINLFVTTGIASGLAEGSISIFNLSNNLQSFPIGIFGISIAVSAFPFLAEAITKNDIAQFRKYFTGSFARIVVFIIPLSILMWLLSENIVRMFFGSGQFGWEDTFITADSLTYFTIGLTGSALIPLFARTFYAAHNTKTPVIISIVSMVVNIVLSFVLAPAMGVPGLALAFSASSTVQALLLLVFLHKMIGNLGLKEIGESVSKIVPASIAMIFVIIALNMGFAQFATTPTFFSVFIQTGLMSSIGAVVYLGVMFAFKDKYIKDALQYINFFSKKS